MALTTRFIPHAVLLKTAAAATNAWVNQISDLSPDEGTSLFEESGGSATDREFTALKDVDPTLSFSTSDLTILATVGMAGLAINNDGSNPGVAAYARELPLGGLPTALATANHVKIQVSDGLVIPVSLRASHNQVAKLSMLLHAILGTGGSSLAAPMVVTASSAIATGAAATLNVFTTGVVKYTISGGASRYVAGIMDIGVDFGIQVLKESSDGEVFPSQIAIISRMPKISFTTKDAALLAEIGNGISVSSFAAYFRNVAANGQRTAMATTSHVSVIGTAGMVTNGAMGMQHKGAGTSSFTFTPSLNTNLLTISTAAAIPTS